MTFRTGKVAERSQREELKWIYLCKCDSVETDRSCYRKAVGEDGRSNSKMTLLCPCSANMASGSEVVSSLVRVDLDFTVHGRYFLSGKICSVTAIHSSAATLHYPVSSHRRNTSQPIWHPSSFLMFVTVLYLY